MKVNRSEKQKVRNENPIIFEWVNTHLVKVFLFVLSLVYFYRYGSYILSFQESQSLFLNSDQYLRGFLNKPGGLLVYAGKFLTVFYSGAFTGAFVLASIIIFLSYLVGVLCKLLGFSTPFSALLSVLPACCLLIMQSHYYHFMEINLGFLLVVSMLVLSVLLDRKQLGFVVLILFPLFYYLAGAFAWFFAIAYLIYRVTFFKGNRRFIESGILVVLAALVLFISEKWIFVQPRNSLIGYPLNLINDSNYRLVFYILVGFFPLIFLLTRFKYPIVKRTTILAAVVSVLIISASGFILFWSYNAQTARVFQVEKYILDENWDDAIRFSERNPSGNLIGQYFYNVALSETGQLCEKLFSGRQNFGVSSLILPWGNEHLNYGAWFYYSVGLINEAQRWAYEDMVVNGFKPSNLKMLVRTNLVNEDYAMALKYISILKKSQNYRKWALEYEKMVLDTTLIAGNAELKYRRSIMPKGDFFIQISAPQNNIPLLLNSNPSNKRAFEYKMAWLMLSKDIEGIATQLKELKNLGYTRIPRHLEETVMIYYNAKGSFPDMGGLSVSDQTRSRFNQYVDIFKANRQNMEVAKQTLGMLFGDTFMYYYHFR